MNLRGVETEMLEQNTAKSGEQTGVNLEENGGNWSAKWSKSGGNRGKSRRPIEAALERARRAHRGSEALDRALVAPNHFSTEEPSFSLSENSFFFSKH